MGNGMNKVLPGFYLGSFRDGKDPQQLHDNKISHIISIHDAAREVVEDKEYLCIQVPDSPDENLSKHFSICNDFIHNARINGGNVLVHCLAGVSRSATIAVAYVMCATSLSCKDALEVVRGARSIASPNYGFHLQLKEYELYALSRERKRLQKKFPKFDAKNDEEECAKMIIVYHSSNEPSAAGGSSTPDTSRAPFSPRRLRPTSSASSSPFSSPRHQSRFKTRSTPCSPKRS